MIFSESEQSEIKKLSEKNPLINRLWEGYDKYQQDPSAEFYLEVVEMTKFLAKEMSNVRNPRIETIEGEKVSVIDAPILLGNDKLFDRIKVLLTDCEKIFAGISKGKQELNRGTEESESDPTNSKKRKLLKQHEGKAII